MCLLRLLCSFLGFLFSHSFELPLTPFVPPLMSGNPPEVSVNIVGLRANFDRCVDACATEGAAGGFPGPGRDCNSLNWALVVVGMDTVSHRNRRREDNSGLLDTARRAVRQMQQHVHVESGPMRRELRIGPLIVEDDFRQESASACSARALLIFEALLDQPPGARFCLGFRYVRHFSC